MMTVKKEELLMKKLEEKFNQIIFERQEKGILHNSIEQNYQWYESFIGERESVFDQEFWDHAFSQENTDENREGGILARDPLRHGKNLVICSIAVLTDRVIRDGILDAELAYSFSDACILLLEECADIEELNRFLVVSTNLYRKEIRANRRGNLYHLYVKKTKEYIYRNLHSKIIISEAAKEIHTSPSYLSQVFKKSEGITIQEYIRRERIRSAENLLKYSRLTVSEISQYLCFSSQSYFCKVFKAETGLSPDAYRKNAIQNM